MLWTWLVSIVYKVSMARSWWLCASNVDNSAQLSPIDMDKHVSKMKFAKIYLPAYIVVFQCSPDTRIWGIGTDGVGMQEQYYQP